MCQGNGCCGSEGCCSDEDCSMEDQEIYLKEREAILEAKLATVKHLIKSLGKKTTQKE